MGQAYVFQLPSPFILELVRMSTFSDISEATEFLLQKIRANPLDVLDFQSVWELAQASGFPMLPLWKIKTHFLALSQKDIQEWENCIFLEVSEKNTQNQEIEAMTQILYQKYPTPHNFLRRFETSQPSESFTLEAYNICGSDFIFGQLLWDKVTSLSLFKSDPEKLTKLYLARLLIPHRQLQQTFESFSSWVSSMYPESYTSLMKEASAIFKDTEMRLRYYEQHESLIADNSNDSISWAGYIDKIAKYTPADASFNQVTQLFLRSLSSGSSKVKYQEWIPVWCTFLKAAENRENSQRFLWCLEFIKTYPHACDPYNMVIRGITIESEIDTVLSLVKKSKCIIAENYSEWKDLAMNLITFQLNSFKHDQERKDNLFETIELLAFPAAEFSDEFHEVVKFSVSILESLNDEVATKLAAKIVSEAFESFALQATFWIYALDFFYRNNRIKHVQKLLTLWQEDAQEIDNRELFLNEIAMFYRLHFDVTAYLEVLDQTDAIRKKILQKPAKIMEKAPELETKRQRTEKPEQNEPVRSREQFRIKITNITSWTTEAEIRAFLEGYGSPLSVQIVHNNVSYAIVEMSSEADVLSSLTRDKKILHGLEVSVSRIFANTVWVTNYPSTFDPSDVEKMIQSTGFEPLSIRFPVQNDFKQRRFCYVDFGSTEDAQSVRNLLHGREIDGLTVQAEISNPSIKRARHTQPVDRQVYVHNLNFKDTTESSLWNLFSTFGDLESIKMPLNMKNKSLGYQNNGFAFITFTTEAGAKEAILLGHAELDGRRVEISVVKPKEAIKKSIRFDKELTLSIHNVNEIITEDRLRAHIESKVGQVSKIQLMPSKKGALVQFSLVANAGRASIVLEGTEFEGQILHVGQMLDFTTADREITHKPSNMKNTARVDTSKETKERSTPKMVPPMLLRKRRR